MVPLSDIRHLRKGSEGSFLMNLREKNEEIGSELRSLSSFIETEFQKPVVILLSTIIKFVEVFEIPFE